MTFEDFKALVQELGSGLPPAPFRIEMMHPPRGGGVVPPGVLGEDALPLPVNKTTMVFSEGQPYWQSTSTLHWGYDGPKDAGWDAVVMMWGIPPELWVAAFGSESADVRDTFRSGPAWSGYVAWALEGGPGVAWMERNATVGQYGFEIRAFFYTYDEAADALIALIEAKRAMPASSEQPAMALRKLKNRLLR